MREGSDDHECAFVIIAVSGCWVQRRGRPMRAGCSGEAVTISRLWRWRERRVRSGCHC